MFCSSMAEGTKLPFEPKLLQSATLSGVFTGINIQDQWMKFPFKVFLDKENQRVAVRTWEPTVEGKFIPSVFSQLTVDYKNGKGIQIYHMNEADIVHCNGFTLIGMDNIFSVNPLKSASFAGFSMFHGSLVSKFSNVTLTFFSDQPMNFEIHLDAFNQQPVSIVAERDTKLEISSYQAGVPDATVFEVPEGLQCEGTAKRSFSLSHITNFRK